MKHRPLSSERIRRLLINEAPPSEWETKSAEKLIDLIDSELRNIFEVLVQDPASAHAVALRSHFHVNGFAKIVLLRSSNRQIRLHVWPNSRPRPDGDIHDHRWPFTSLPLVGSFEENRYLISDEGLTTNQHICHPRAGKTWIRLSGYQSIALKQCVHAIRSKAATYYCEAGEIHQFTPLGTSTAATLVVAGRSLPSHARVFSERPRTSGTLLLPSPYLTGEKLIDLVRELSAEM